MCIPHLLHSSNTTPVGILKLIIRILSPPRDGMVINTLLTQVRKEKNGKINGVNRVIITILKT